MKEKIIELLIKLGIIKEDQKQTVQAELDKIAMDEPGKTQTIDTSKITDPAVKQMFEQMQTTLAAVQAQNKTLIDTITNETKMREDGIKAQQEEIKKANEKKISDAVDKAIKDQKFPEGERENLTEMAKSNFKSFEHFVAITPVNKHFVNKETKAGDQKTKTQQNVNSEVDGFKPTTTIGKAILETGNFVQQ